jgi:NitT/TauT family transport system substrate-binding protein
MRRSIFSVMAMALVLLVSGCTRESAREPITIGYQEIALYRHLFTAKAKGYFGQEGLNVEIKPFVSANRMIEGMVAGELEGTGLTNLQVALTVEAKDPQQLRLVNMLVWEQQSYPDYVLVAVDTGIRTLKELEGRTMGLHPGSAVKAFSKVLLQQSGVDLGKVAFLELEPNIMQAAILAHRVDALYCMDPVATTLIQAGQARVLVPNPMRYIFEPPVPISGTALSGKFIRERPKDAQKVIRALDKAIMYIRDPKHAEEIAGYISQYAPISKEMALKTNPSEYWCSSEMDRKRTQALADRFLELGIVDKAVDVNQILLPPDFLGRKR